MYLQDAYKNLRGAPKELTDTRKIFASARGKNVLILGATSLFTDISSEMVLAILPLFLTEALGFSIVSFGLFEGAYQIAAMSLRLWGGSLADRQNNHKKLATAGYAISALSKLGLFLTTLFAWIPAVAFLLIDRVGKGIRVAPRDALLSLSAPQNMLSTAFGIHRTLDTFGALLGPFVAYLLLLATPGSFSTIFFASTAIAFIGLAIISLLASQPPPSTTAPATPKSRTIIKETIRNKNVRRVSLAAGALAFMTVSDSFIYLLLLRGSDVSPAYFPLLYSGTAITYLFLAIPLGRIADKIGRRLVFLAGHMLLLIIYATLATQTYTRTTFLIVLGMLGLYYAMTDGVISSLASSLTTRARRGTAIATVGMSTAIAKLFSAVLFGLLWQYSGMQTALSIYGVGLALSLLLSLLSLSKITEAPK